MFLFLLVVERTSAVRARKAYNFSADSGNNCPTFNVAFRLLLYRYVYTVGGVLMICTSTTTAVVLLH